MESLRIVHRTSVSVCRTVCRCSKPISSWNCFRWTTFQRFDSLSSCVKSCVRFSCGFVVKIRRCTTHSRITKFAHYLGVARCRRCVIAAFRFAGQLGQEIRKNSMELDHRHAAPSWNCFRSTSSSTVARRSSVLVPDSRRRSSTPTKR